MVSCETSSRHLAMVFMTIGAGEREFLLICNTLINTQKGYRLQFHYPLCLGHFHSQREPARPGPPRRAARTGGW